MSELRPAGYQYFSTAASHTHSYLWKPIFTELNSIPWPSGPRRVFEIGCGNGALAAALSGAAFEVVGVDPSEDGIPYRKPHLPEIIPAHRIGI